MTRTHQVAYALDIERKASIVWSWPLTSLCRGVWSTELQALDTG